jgi:hypothetical protein
MASFTWLGRRDSRDGRAIVGRWLIVGIRAGRGGWARRWPTPCTTARGSMNVGWFLRLVRREEITVLQGVSQLGTG